MLVSGPDYLILAYLMLSYLVLLRQGGMGGMVVRLLGRESREVG